MKKSISVSLAGLAVLVATSSASAFWGNNYGGYGNWNPYDPWDPRFWMEEMEQMWDDDYYGGGPWGGPWGGPYGAPYGYGYAPAPYGAPYGYPPMPAPAPAPVK